MADKQPKRHDKKTTQFSSIAVFPLNAVVKKVNLLKLFIFPFVERNMVEICFLTSKYFAENISVICWMFMSKKHSFLSLFTGCNVHFGLEINSVEVILVYFSVFSIVRVFLAFKTYSILTIFVIVICRLQRSSG